MFKKTLLAATIAVVSTGAMAVDVSGVATTTATMGSEALNNGLTKNDFTALTLGDVQLALGAEYSVGDIIKINLSGASFKATDSFALTSSDALVVQAGFLSATANQLVFRITTASGSTVGQTLTLASGSKIKLDSVAVGSKVTVSAAAETSTGIAIDVTGLTDSKKVIDVIQQHKFAVTTKLNEKIDVADERKALTDTTDMAVVTYTEAVPTFGATDFDVSGAGDMSFTVNGSFTGFETGVTGATNKGTVVIDGVAATVAADLQSGSADLPATITSDTMNIVFTPDTAATTRVVLNASSYTVDVELTDGTYTTAYDGLSAGEFALNGSSAEFAYVPVNYNGAVTTQFEIGNKGKVDGEITISGFDTDGNTYSKTLEKKAEAGKLTKLSDAEISTAFGLTKGTKLNLTITVNAPTADITYGAYSNRGTTGRMAINKL